jgi:hypothetical protein
MGKITPPTFGNYWEGTMSPLDILRGFLDEQKGNDVSTEQYIQRMRAIGKQQIDAGVITEKAVNLAILRGLHSISAYNELVEDLKPKILYNVGITSEEMDRRLIQSEVGQGKAKRRWADVVAAGRRQLSN